MRINIVFSTILFFCTTPAFAAGNNQNVDNKSQKISDEARVEAFIESMPDMNIIAGIASSGADTIKRAKSGEDNCKTVQEGYKTMIKSALGKDSEAPQTPVYDYNAALAAAMREAIAEDTKRK